MMTNREVWLKAMEIVETHGANDASRAMGAFINNVEGEPEWSQWSEWLRVAAAVDKIAGATAQ